MDQIGEVGSAISNPSRIQDVVDASGTGCRGVCQCQPAQASAAAKLLEPQMGVAAGRPAPPGRVAVAGRRRRPARLRPLPGPSAAAGGPARTPRLAARRWMMLPEGHGLYPGHADLGGYARFLNLDTRRMVRARRSRSSTTAAPSTPSTASSSSSCCGTCTTTARRPPPPPFHRRRHRPPTACPPPPAAGHGATQLPCAIHRLKKLTNVACAAACFGNRGRGGAITVTE